MSTYGLESTLKVEGVDVTNQNRKEALDYTNCETLRLMDQAAASVGPHFRRYGATAAAIIEQFIAARGVIEEEMARIAARNLECVVTENRVGLRMLNNDRYAEAKAERTAGQEAARAALDPDSSVDDDDIDIDDDGFVPEGGKSPVGLPAGEGGGKSLTGLPAGDAGNEDDEALLD